MGPKKGRSGPTAKPATVPLPQIHSAELKQAQTAYQHAINRPGKKVSDSIDTLRAKGTHLSRITILRLLLEKHEGIKQHHDELASKSKGEGYSSWLRDQLASFSEQAERPLTDGRMSCTLLTALAGCWRHYVAQQYELSDSEKQQILGMLLRGLSMGFSKDSWSKDWLDPRSEMIAATELKVGNNNIAFVAERPNSLHMLAEQFKQLATYYLLLHTVFDGKQWQYPPPSEVLESTELIEARALAAEAAKATAAEPKQLDPKLVQQQTLREQQQTARNEQQQQQAARGRGARDTDRRDRDVTRGAGKEAEDLLKDKELQVARQAEDELRKEANKVLGYLEGKLLRPDQPLDRQQQLAELERMTALPPSRISEALKKFKDAKDSPGAETVLENCKHQFGDLNPSDAALTSQLKDLNSSAGCVFLDEVLIADSNIGPSSKQQRTWDSFEAFEEHIRSTYLSKGVGFGEHAAFSPFTANPPDLKDVYDWRFGDLLSDHDDHGGHHMMNGVNGHVANGLLKNRKWLEALEEECPLVRFLNTLDVATDEFKLTDIATEAHDYTRLNTAIGFALLQLQRGVITPDPLVLSHEQPWVLLAYHTLKLLPAYTGANPSHEDYMIYYFWNTQPASEDEYQRVMSSDTDAYPDSTDGAVGDCIAMLKMLNEAQLLQGPLLLAVQLYLLKHGNAELDTDDLAQGRYMDADKAVNRLRESEQNALRVYLFRALQHAFASLPCYRRFLELLEKQVHKPAAVPVQFTDGGKGDARLSLWPAYWEQACRSAAVPSEHHTACCNKHATLRTQSEAQGQAFSKFDPAGDYESFFCDQDAVQQADGSVAHRYLVKPLHVVQAQHDSGIEIGTPEGLKALVDQLYLGPDQHPLMSKVGVQPAVEPNIPKRSSWDKVYTSLLIAQQLAVHRQQLAKLIEDHSRRLEANQFRLSEREAQDMLRALFCQRVAGRDWILQYFCQMFEQQQTDLQDEERTLQGNLRMLGAVPEHKTNKSNKLDNSKEKEKELNEKLQRCGKGITEISGYLANIKILLADNNTEAESYPDLLRVRHKVAAGQSDSIQLMLQVLCNELVNDNKNAANTCAQLEDAVKLSRQMLFELDSLILYHVLQARQRVLVSAWSHKEVPVAALLAADSMKTELQTHIQEAAMAEILAWNDDDKKATQQQATSKKKKKKKGPAPKSAAAKAAAAEPGSDEQDEEQQAAAEDQQQQEEEEEDVQQHELPSDDGEDGMIDITAIFHRHSRGSRDDSSSSSSSKPAAAAGRGPKGAAAASSEAAASAASKSSRPVRMTAQQLENERYIYYTTGTPICGRCGDIGHKTGDCRAPYCGPCDKYGHEPGRCGSVCKNCGRKNHGSRAIDEGCKLRQCGYCKLMGHVVRECPNITCKRCGLLGHKTADCREEVYACKHCGQPQYERHECMDHTQPVKPAAVDQPVPLAAAAAASNNSRGRPPAVATPPPQQQATGSSAAPAADKARFAAANVKLMTVAAADLPGRREKLLNALFERGAGDYAIGLVPSEDKQSVLARISDHDMAAILKQPNIAAVLDEVYSIYQKTQPVQGKGDSPQPAAAKEADRRQKQQEVVGSSRAAEQRAPAAVANRDAGDGRPPQLHPRSPAAAAAATGHPAHAAATANKPAAAAPAAAGAPPAVVLSAEVSAPAARGASDQQQPTIQALPAQQQQRGPKQPHPLYAQPAAARPAESDAWDGPPQPAPAAAVAPQLVLDLSGSLEPWMCWFKPSAVHVVEQLVSDVSVKQQLLNVVAAAAEEHLAMALNAELLPVLKRLKDAGAGPVPNSDGLLTFASLVANAKLMQPPVQPRLTAAPGQEPPPPPAVSAAMSAAALAPSLALPPHLQHATRGQQQQAGGQLPFPQQAAALAPPTVVHQLLGAPLALPLQQQQQLPAAPDPAQPDGEQSDNEDEMFNCLIGSDNAGPSQPPASRPVWAPAAQQQHGMISSEFPSLGASAPGSRAGPAVSSAGLANETGEYNCFLNVVVQCLYSCKAFREQVRALPPYQQGNPVVHALLQLFQQMQAAEQGWKPGQDRAVVNPTELREALDSATQFRRQEMNDANELIDCMFECFKAAQGSSNVTGSRGVLIDSVFGLKVNEKVRCTEPGCGVVSHIIASRWEHLIVVNSMALGFAAEDARMEFDLPPGAQLDLGLLLRVLVDQEQKACDKDVGGCGTLYAPERMCEQAPRVLTLQLVWSQDVSGEVIGTALAHILEAVDISAIYAAGVANSDTTYHLGSAVAYYGQHYMAFVRNEKLNQWLMFDDASVSVVGSWEDVKRKCVNGRIQPSVLFYQVMDLAALPDRTSAPPPAAQPTAAAVPGVNYQPVHGAYTAGPRPPAAAATGQWGPARSVVPHPMHLIQQQQHPQQQPVPRPAAVVAPGMPSFMAHQNAAAAAHGPLPPAAAAPQHPWGAAGPHSGNSTGTIAAPAAADGWLNSNGSAADAWGNPTSTLPPTAAAAADPLPGPPAAAGVRPAQPRPAWGGAGSRVAQVAFGGIADQAARGAGGQTAAPGGHRGHGAPRGRGRG